MDIEAMLTALSANDPWCNLYTLTKTHTVEFSDGLTEQHSKELRKQHTVKGASYADAEDRGVGVRANLLRRLGTVSQPSSAR